MQTCMIKFCMLTGTNYDGLSYLGRNNYISLIRLRNCKNKQTQIDMILSNLKRTAQMCNNCVIAVSDSIVHAMAF